MATRRRTTGQDIAQDAQHVLTKLAQARVQAKLKKAEKGRKKKGSPPRFMGVRSRVRHDAA